MRPIHGLAAAIVTGMMLTACGDDPGGTVATPDDNGHADVDGSWELTSGSGPDGELALVEGSPVTLEIDGEELGGTACNHYGATMTRDGDDVSIQIGSMTEMACEHDIMTLESHYHAALGAVSSMEHSADELVLTGPDVELRFTEIPPVPTAELVGTTWVLESLIDGETASSVSGEPATLTLEDDGTVTGSTGCRELTGTYTESTGEIKVTEFGLQGECDAELSDQDSHIVEVMEGGFRAEVDGDTLRITSRGGTGLVYVAS